MNYFYNIFLLFFVIIKVHMKVNPIVIPFETVNKKDLNPEKYFFNKFTNELKIMIKVGSHRQPIPCYLNLNSHTLYICGSNSDLNNGQPKYEESKSSKYSNLSDTTTSESFYVIGMPSKDEICLNDNYITDLKFYLAKTKFSSNELIYSCMIGLGYEEVFYDDDDAEGYLMEIESFLSQLKQKNLINKKVFFLKYNENDDNGEIIFGAFPHEIKENYGENLNEEDYIEGDNVYMSDIQIVWSIKGYIYSGEKLMFNYLSSIDFEFNQGFIIGSYSYKKDILSNFFNEKLSSGECSVQEIYQQKRAFYGFYCKKNIDITKFENLRIILDKIKYKIEFTYEDLFTLNGDFLYFNVLFKQDEDDFKNDFILGKPVFKKYPIVFNFVRKSEKIGFYNNLLFKKNSQNNIINDKTGGRNNNLIILLILVGIIIIGLLSYIIVRYYKRPRKQKVNELIEFYDYSAKQTKV